LEVFILKKSVEFSIIMGAIVLFCLLAVENSFAKTVRIKFASLAPEGTAWARILEEGAKEVKKETAERVKIRYYLGGKKGEEVEMMQKMKIGEIDAVEVSGMGLGEIVKEIRVMDLPLLFRNYTEFDYVRFKLFHRFAKSFKKAGYILLGLNETGFVHIFSNTPIREIKDMEKVKIWVYKGEPIGSAMIDAMKMNAVPLGITDVLTSLQTGLIDACYAPPIGAIAFQWHTKVKYISTMPLTNGIGGTIMRKTTFNKIIPKDQKILREVFWHKNEEMVKKTRQDNEKARKDLITRFGLKETEPTNQGRKDFKKASTLVRKRLVGEFYSQALLDDVMRFIQECSDMGENKCAKAVRNAATQAKMIQ
jgi:TRAP-type C4-dicarboxylate transport system substrate-binding protein